METEYSCVRYRDRIKQLYFRTISAKTVKVNTFLGGDRLN